MQYLQADTPDVPTAVSAVAGRFECDKCQQRLVAGAQYFLILLAAILINMFLIWRLLKEDVAAWDHVEGSDCVEVCVRLI